MDPTAHSCRYPVSRLLCVLLAGLLAVSLSRFLSFKTAPGVQEPPSLSSSQTPVAVPSGSSTTSEAAPSQEQAADLNVLLIGHDRQEGESGSRSDTILLCTFRAEDNTLILTSILRDLYVPIPGHGSNRINAAYASGGTELLMDTLESNFGIRPDMAVEVDFSGFAEIIDLLGGVSLELRQDEAEAVNKSTQSSLTAGKQLLSGKQALAYARIRKLDADGDFSRTARQRRLVEAVLQGCRSTGPLTLLSVLRKAMPLIQTDTDRESLLSMAIEMLPKLSRLSVRGQHIPAEGTYEYQTVKGMSVLKADLEAARQLLLDTAAGASG